MPNENQKGLATTIAELRDGLEKLVHKALEDAYQAGLQDAKSALLTSMMAQIKDSAVGAPLPVVRPVQVTARKIHWRKRRVMAVNLDRTNMLGRHEKLLMAQFANRKDHPIPFEELEKIMLPFYRLTEAEPEWKARYRFRCVFTRLESRKMLARDSETATIVLTQKGLGRLKHHKMLPPENVVESAAA